MNWFYSISKDNLFILDWDKIEKICVWKNMINSDYIQFTYNILYNIFIIYLSLLYRLYFNFF